MKEPQRKKKSEFLDSVQKGLLLGAAILALVLPPVLYHRAHAPQASLSTGSPLLADFGEVKPSDDARRVADWSMKTHDHQKMSFIIVDKKQARVYVFDPAGHLKASAYALLGSAIGDDTVPGIGTKPIALVTPEERTTPAGRFIAQPGISTSRNEDVVWVDYDAAVSMHRVINFVKAERRLERIVSTDPAEHRISYGCINLPRDFYENAVAPAARTTGAVIYVLPETRSVEQQFGAFDVEGGAKVAALDSQARQ
ncbi:MAG: hypothetical protein ACXWJM_17335 [Ramlibacter sp.]